MRGFTLWARQTIESDIFKSKPDKWFKMWFYIVNRVNWKPSAKYRVGECFIPSGEIERETGATKDQVKKFLAWTRESTMISTKRSTRGIHVKVLNYAKYQDFDTYKGTREALEKHQRSTTIVETGKQVNNISEQSSQEDKKKDMFNKYNENQHTDDIPSIDADSGEEIQDVDKQKEDNKKVTELIHFAEKLRGKKFIDRPTQRKFIHDMRKAKLSPGLMRRTFTELVQSDYWQKSDRLPDFKTVYSNLKNKK